MRIRIVAIIVLVCAISNTSCTCTNQGLFPNPNDVTCQSYIFCAALSDGLLIEKIYNCSNGTLYNPQLKTCTVNYKCQAYSEETTATTIPPDVDNCTAQGRFPSRNDSTCTSYYFCYYLNNGQYLKMYYTCPIGTRFNPKLQNCNSKYQCTLSTTSVFSTPKSSKFVCTKQGKFPVVEDLTCATYYYCLFLPSGEEVQLKYRCPDSKKFDPVLQTCSQNYRCPIETTTSQIIISTTESEFSFSVTSKNDEILNDSSQCTSPGRFPEEDPSCQLYRYCYYLPTGKLNKQLYKCIEEEKFDPVLRTCSETYRCSIENTTAHITSTSEKEFSGSVTSKNNEIVNDSSQCISPGRFPEEDPSCQLYKYCYYLPSGNLNKQMYKCIGEEKFDPVSKICTENYECLEDYTTEILSSSTTIITTTTPTTIAITTTPITTTPITTTSTATSTTTVEYTTTTTTNTAATTPTTATIPYCTNIGKYPVDYDITCRTYYYCLYLPNGQFGQQFYSCNVNEMFNPDLQECTKNYRCL